MKKWKDFKGWQKGSVVGFSVLGVGHILILTLDLLTRSKIPIEGEAGLSYLIIELPLAIVNIFLEYYFNIRSYPESVGSTLWVYYYVFGTIAWGIVGSVLGFILGFLSDLMRAKRGGQNEKAS